VIEGRRYGSGADFTRRMTPPPGLKAASIIQMCAGCVHAEYQLRADAGTACRGQRLQHAAAVMRAASPQSPGACIADWHADQQPAARSRC
jgi:hypothetical protein